MDEGSILLVDECSGIYVPVRFARWAQEVAGVAVLNVTPADLDELARGPDVDGYWDLWDEILRDVELVDCANGGVHYTLYQDGGLWAVPKS